MSLQKTLRNNNNNLHFIKRFTKTPPNSSSSTSPTSWRIQAEKHQLISQVSSILLQRNNWLTLLKTLNISSKLTPSIFLQILHKIQSNPQISLNFFNWVSSNFVGFQPDLNIQCKIIKIVIGTGETRPIKPIFDSVIELNPPTHVVNSMIQACKGTDLHSFAFSSIIECYAQKGSYIDGLKVYRRIVSYGYLPKVHCLNAMLDVLEYYREHMLAYCLFGSMIRNGILLNDDTWSVFGRILCENGKFESVVRLLDSGVRNVAIFDLVVDGYSRIGSFEAAFEYVNEMSRRNFEPGFGTYGSILNGACEFGDANVINAVMCAMRGKKLLSENLSLGYDDVIVKLCDLNKVFAANYLFKRMRDEGVGLKDGTFGCMLSALCKEGEVDEAIALYRVISKEKIVVNESCYQELAGCLCRKEPSDDIIQLLMHFIKKDCIPSIPAISKFMMKLGRKDRWFEVEPLLNVTLQATLLPDSGFCRLLVKYYCSSSQIDSALMLHDKLGEQKTLWDVTTYNVLLRALFMEKRVNEAINIFECMKKNNILNRASFLVMISGLSQEKEMRKAMQVHDEMLKLGLKPSLKTYKSLISVFR